MLVEFSNYVESFSMILSDIRYIYRTYNSFAYFSLNRAPCKLKTTRQEETAKDIDRNTDDH